MQELPQERLLIAELGISASEFMFEETRTYVKQREAFRKTVAHIQVSLKNVFVFSLGVYSGDRRPVRTCPSVLELGSCGSRC
nr:PREDICTED: long-chain specific acyl-CoA dehydrogenase, mitochondrial-like [Equus przewalskii]